MTLEEFGQVVERDYREWYIRTYGNKHPELVDQTCEVTVKYGSKYACVDIGAKGMRSGKYMVVLPGWPDAGTIYGIKAYGVIHRGHQYGTLDTVDDWYWGGYTARKR